MPTMSFLRWWSTPPPKERHLFFHGICNVLEGKNKQTGTIKQKSMTWTTRTRGVQRERKEQAHIRQRRHENVRLWAGLWRTGRKGEWAIEQREGHGEEAGSRQRNTVSCEYAKQVWKERERWCGDSNCGTAQFVKPFLVSIHHLTLIFKASLRDRATEAQRTGARQLRGPVFRMKRLSLGRVQHSSHCTVVTLLI